MKRVRGSSGRLVSCVLSLVLLTGPLFQGKALAHAAESLSASVALTNSAQSALTVDEAPATVVRELVEARTETSRELLLSDGTIRAEYFGSPLYYRDPESKRLLPIDTSLVPAVSGGRAVAVNRANSFRLELPETLQGDWVSVETTRGAKVSIRPAQTGSGRAASTVPGTWASVATSGSERLYPVFDRASLSYESIPSGLKETIVLHETGAADTYRFEMRALGAMPELLPDGSISFTEPGGNAPVMRIPAPFMWDSAQGPAGPAFSESVRYELTSTNESWQLDVIADRKWLDDPARAYPVFIDPTIQVSSSGGTHLADSFISSKSGLQNTNYSAHPTVWVKHNAGGTWTEYGLVQLRQSVRNDMAAKLASGLYVVGGRLRLHANSISTAGQVMVQRVTTHPLDITAVTWNHQHPAVTSIPGASWVTVNSTGWKTFEMTSAFALWQQQVGGSCIVRLGANNGGHVSFRSCEYSGTGLPTIEVEYAAKPSVAVTSPAGGDVLAVPMLEWTYDDPLQNPQVEYEAQVALSPGGTPVASASGAGALTTREMPAPAGGWQPGTTYHVRVRAASSPTAATPRLWSEWSAPVAFRPTVPAALTDVAVTTSAGGWHTETDADGDGLADLPNDDPAAGRGSVALSWEPVTGATGYHVYLSDGHSYRQVASTQATAWTSAGAGLFPSGSAIAAMPQGTTADPFLAGGGLDLSDDPRALYAKTAGTAMDGVAAYSFKVVPYGALGAAPLEDTPQTLVALDDRTIGVNDAARETAASLGEFAGHDAEAVLSQEAL
ncbi:MAG: hypothetical protein IBX63_06435, partial [Coriobacteriia bacterium]|nr:hypothetical protein [Coriobacteriia bacterium]